MKWEKARRVVVVRKWGTFPVPVHVPLNKLECKNIVEEPKDRR